MSVNILDTYAAAFAAVFGGIGVKVLEKMMSKRSEQFLESTKLRDELRLENTTLRKESDDASKDSDLWRAKYYEQMEENMKLSNEINSAKTENHQLRTQLTSTFPIPSHNSLPSE